jgi:hypothetical protein
VKRATSSVLKVLASLSLMEKRMRSQWLGIHMVLQTIGLLMLLCQQQSA